MCVLADMGERQTLTARVRKKKHAYLEQKLYNCDVESALLTITQKSKPPPQTHRHQISTRKKLASRPPL